MLRCLGIISCLLCPLLAQAQGENFWEGGWTLKTSSSHVAAIRMADETLDTLHYSCDMTTDICAYELVITQACSTGTRIRFLLNTERGWTEMIMTCTEIPQDSGESWTRLSPTREIDHAKLEAEMLKDPQEIAWLFPTVGGGFDSVRFSENTDPISDIARYVRGQLTEGIAP